MLDAQISNGDQESKFNEVSLNSSNTEPHENMSILKSSITEMINQYKIHLKNNAVQKDGQLTCRLLSTTSSNKSDCTVASTFTDEYDDIYICKNLRNDLTELDQPKKDMLVPVLDFSKLNQASKTKRKSQPKRTCISSQHTPDLQLSARTKNSLKGHINQLLMIDEYASPQNLEESCKSEEEMEEDTKYKPTKLKRSKSRSPGKMNIIQGHRFKHTESIIIPLKHY